MSGIFSYFGLGQRRNSAALLGDSVLPSVNPCVNTESLRLWRAEHLQCLSFSLNMLKMLSRVEVLF